METLLLFSMWLFREGHVPEPQSGSEDGWQGRATASAWVVGSALVGVLEVGPSRPGGPTQHRRETATMEGVRVRDP